MPPRGTALQPTTARRPLDRLPGALLPCGQPVHVHLKRLGRRLLLEDCLHGRIQLPETIATCVSRRAPASGRQLRQLGIGKSGIFEAPSASATFSVQRIPSHQRYGCRPVGSVRHPAEGSAGPGSGRTGRFRSTTIAFSPIVRSTPEMLTTSHPMLPSLFSCAPRLASFVGTLTTAYSQQSGSTRQMVGESRLWS